MLIWVDQWQMECCGEPFAIGGRVEWELHDQIDRDWYGMILGEERAGQITHGEDRHESVDAPTTTTSVTVRRIRAVTATYGPAPDDPHIFQPIPDSGALVDVDHADGQFPEIGQVMFLGYLVDAEAT